MKRPVKIPKSKFLSIQCKKCKNEQIVFSKSATQVNCLKCGEILIESAGGEGRIKGIILRVLS